MTHLILHAHAAIALANNSAAAPHTKAPPAAGEKLGFGAVNELFAKSINGITTGADGALDGVIALLFALATLELILFCYKAYKGASDPSQFFMGVCEKCAHVLIVLALTLSWGKIANGVKGYLLSGAAAVGGQQGSISSLNPAAIAANGARSVNNIFSPDALDAISSGESFFGTSAQESDIRAKKRAAKAAAPAQEEGLTSKVGEAVLGAPPGTIIEEMATEFEATALELVSLMVFIALGLLIICVHFYVAVQVFVITIEFYIMVTITQLLIPLAVNKYLSPIATASLNALFGKSIKFAVMGLILSLFSTGISTLQLSTSPDLLEMLALLLVSAIMAFMVAQSHQIAASIFSGGGQGVDMGGALMAGSAMAAGMIVAGSSRAAAGAGGWAGARIGNHLEQSERFQRAREFMLEQRTFGARRSERDTTRAPDDVSATTEPQPTSQTGQPAAGQPSAPRMTPEQVLGQTQGDDPAREKEEPS